jgi:hypothetical protein
MRRRAPSAVGGAAQIAPVLRQVDSRVARQRIAPRRPAAAAFAMAKMPMGRTSAGADRVYGVTHTSAGAAWRPAHGAPMRPRPNRAGPTRSWIDTPVRDRLNIHKDFHVASPETRPVRM